MGTALKANSANVQDWQVTKPPSRIHAGTPRPPAATTLIDLLPELQYDPVWSPLRVAFLSSTQQLLSIPVRQAQASQMSA